MSGHDSSQPGRLPQWQAIRGREAARGLLALGLKPSEGMGISVERRGSFAIVRVSGELDIVGAPELRRTLEAVQGLDCDVAVDLSGVDFVDSSGLRVFVEANQRAVDQHRRFVIVGVQSCAWRTIHVSGLDDVLCFETDVGALDRDL